MTNSDVITDTLRARLTVLSDYRRDMQTALFEVRLRDKLFRCGRPSRDQMALEFALGRVKTIGLSTSLANT